MRFLLLLLLSITVHAQLTLGDVKADKSEAIVDCMEEIELQHGDDPNILPDEIRAMKLECYDITME